MTLRRHVKSFLVKSNFTFEKKLNKNSVSEKQREKWVQGCFPFSMDFKQMNVLRYLIGST